MSQRAEGPPTSNVMDVSTYSQVVFKGVPPSYVPSVPVECWYTLTAAIEPHRRDWVGIFKVGWSTTKDYYTFVWAAPYLNRAGEEPVELHVEFDAYYLPKEDGEFYQFCFVDSTGQVRGASTPFRFESPPESSLDNGMDSDILVITTQEQVELVEKEKEELHEEMEQQKETIHLLRAELNEKVLEINSLKESRNELHQSVCLFEQAQAERERERMEERKQREIEKAQLETNVQNTAEVEECRRKVEELKQSLSALEEKHQKAVAKITQLKQEKSELKDEVTAQQVEIAQLNSSIRGMDLEKQHNLEEWQKQHDRIVLLQVDLESSQKESVKLAGELRGLRAQAEAAEGLRQENQTLQRALSEQDKKDREDLEKQLQELKEELLKERLSSEEARNRTGQALRELAEAEEKLKQLRDVQITLDEQVNLARIMKAQKDQLSEENQELRKTIEKLSEELTQLKVLPTASLAGQLNPGADALLYGNPYEAPGTQETDQQLMMCRFCQELFPGISRVELVQHEETHKLCPFCPLIGDNMSQNDFEEHVYSHE
ncbi:hypothetical protein GJAV_G00152410 [Gymnothorax javanicus]|nr:hypothetical protein GJAV_G00152410 [Gymnothorax javanicus]